MGNNMIVACNGLSGSAHPGTGSCAVRGGCVMVGVLCEMRGIGPMHGSHDEHENQAEGNCQTFLIEHINLPRQKT